MKSILSATLLALISFTASVSSAAEFCVAHWSDTFQFKEAFGVYLTANCEGEVISSDRVFMKVSKSQTEDLEQQLISRMDKIDYSPVARLNYLMLFQKGDHKPKDICAIELSEKFGLTLSCSNKTENVRIYVDDLEVHKFYLERLGYTFVSEIHPVVAEIQKRYLIYQK